MKVLRFFAIVFILATLGSCRPPFEPYTTTIEHLMPLSSGNYWTYSVRLFNEKGIVTDSFTETLSLIDTQRYDGFQGYVVDFGTGHLGLWYDDHSDLIQVSDTNGNSLPILRYPMNPGETTALTRGVIHDLGKFEKDLKYIGENQTVDIPSGSYSCYHYTLLTSIDTSDGMHLYRTQDSYYASNIGLVEEVDSTVMNGVMMKSEIRQLSSYMIR